MAEGFISRHHLCQGEAMGDQGLQVHPPRQSLLQQQVARGSGLLAWLTWQGILAIPPLVGLLSLFIDEEPTPGIGAKMLQLLQGYLIAPGSSAAILLMVVTAVGLWPGNTWRGCRSSISRSRISRAGTPTVLNDLCRTLRKSGYRIAVRPSPGTCACRCGCCRNVPAPVCRVWRPKRRACCRETATTSRFSSISPTSPAVPAVRRPCTCMRSSLPICLLLPPTSPGIGHRAYS